MKLKVESLAGSPERPACVFAPGLGMEGSIWAAPSEARVLGGLFPLGRIYKGREMKTLYHDLAARGHAVVTWSPRRPVGPIAEAVRELYEVVEHARKMETNGIILIGHSRGGLVARMALPGLLKEGVPVKALVTIASPHMGSNMARWAAFLAPFAEFADRLIPESDRGTFLKAIKRTLGFFSSPGVKELLPGSELFKSLESEKPSGVYCLSVGGTSPALVELGYISIPGTFQKILPALPEEMAEGKGDCLVTDASARLPFADEHLSFPKNHLTLLFDEEAGGEVLRRIEKSFDDYSP